MVSLKVTKMGESVGIILPKEVLERVKLGEGDTVFLTESSEGLRITSYDPAFEEDMRIAREVMGKRRNLLRELAK
jgi:putative addiction module antidote